MASHNKTGCTTTNFNQQEEEDNNNNKNSTTESQQEESDKKNLRMNEVIREKRDFRVRKIREKAFGHQHSSSQSSISKKLKTDESVSSDFRFRVFWLAPSFHKGGPPRWQMENLANRRVRIDDPIFANCEGLICLENRSGGKIPKQSKGCLAMIFQQQRWKLVAINKLTKDAKIAFVKPFMERDDTLVIDHTAEVQEIHLSPNSERVDAVHWGRSRLSSYM